MCVKVILKNSVIIQRSNSIDDSANECNSNLDHNLVEFAHFKLILASKYQTFNNIADMHYAAIYSQLKGTTNYYIHIMGTLAKLISKSYHDI